jgi:uncharacterized membrane protein
LRGGRLRRFSVVLLAAVLLISPEVLLAKPRRGGHVVIQFKNQSELNGELIAVRGNSLLILDSAGSDTSVDLAEVAQLHLHPRKSKRANAALVGGLVGAAGGAALGLINESEVPEAAVIGCASIGALAGALVVVGITHFSAKKNYSLEGMTERQLRSMLVRLREEARNPSRL